MASSNASPLAKYKLVRAWQSLGACAGGGPLQLHLNEVLTACAPWIQVFLGDQSVGKTSIITRFMYDKFDNTYQVIGAWAAETAAAAAVAGHASALELP